MRGKKVLITLLNSHTFFNYSFKNESNYQPKEICIDASNYSLKVKKRDIRKISTLMIKTIMAMFFKLWCPLVRKALNSQKINTP